MNDELVVTRRPIIWRAAAAVYAVVNFGGAVYALATGEMMHAGVHVALLFAGYLAWQLIPGGRQKEVPRTLQSDQQLEYLQQSVDAIAVEVERIGEAQRFTEKLRAEPNEKPENKP